MIRHVVKNILRWSCLDKTKHLKGKMKRSALTLMLWKLLLFVNVIVYTGHAGKSSSFLMFTSLCSLCIVYLVIINTVVVMARQISGMEVARNVKRKKGTSTMCYFWCVWHDCAAPRSLSFSLQISLIFVLLQTMGPMAVWTTWWDNPYTSRFTQHSCHLRPHVRPLTWSQPITCSAPVVPKPRQWYVLKIVHFKPCTAILQGYT